MLALRLILDREAIKAATIVVCVIAIAFAPLWGAFLEAVRAQAGFVANATPDSLFLRMMPGAYAAFGRSWVAHLLFSSCAVAVLARYRQFDAFTLATAAFLILPYAHNYDMTDACLGPAILLWERWSTLSSSEKAILAAGYLSPAVTFVAAWLVPVMLLMCLLVQSRRHRIEGWPNGLPESREQAQNHKAFRRLQFSIPCPGRDTPC